MRIAIVDDLCADSAALHDMLTMYTQAAASVDVYSSGERFLDSKIK